MTIEVACGGTAKAQTQTVDVIKGYECLGRCNNEFAGRACLDIVVDIGTHYPYRYAHTSRLRSIIEYLINFQSCATWIIWVRRYQCLVHTHISGIYLSCGIILHPEGIWLVFSLSVIPYGTMSLKHFFIDRIGRKVEETLFFYVAQLTPVAPRTQFSHHVVFAQCPVAVLRNIKLLSNVYLVNRTHVHIMGEHQANILKMRDAVIPYHHVAHQSVLSLLVFGISHMINCHLLIVLNRIDKCVIVVVKSLSTHRRDNSTVIQLKLIIEYIDVTVFLAY